MMQIQINIKDTVKFLAQPQDPQDSVVQVTEARSFISVKTMSVRLNMTNAIATDLSVVTFTLQASTLQGGRGRRRAWPRPSSNQGMAQEQLKARLESTACLCQSLHNPGLAGSWQSISWLRCREALTHGGLDRVPLTISLLHK